MGYRLSPDELRRMDAYWRATNYLCGGMIYLRRNPLLREPLKPEHIKRRLLGHWGSDPGQTFIWTHLNRLIKERDLDVLYVSGPGHGAPAVLAHSYLEGVYGEVYPDKSEDEKGLLRFFQQFSFPGGIGSHCTPETPGSMHEGGELGYSLSHAYGAAFDNPDLIVACVVGDGEAETGPLATSWHSNKFLNPIRDGAVLPILHLNGYKISNPTILSRISNEELESLFVGYGYTPVVVEGDDPEVMHQKMAAALEDCVDQIRAVQQEARRTGKPTRPRWPMIILRTPKGWTGIKEVDGHKVEGFWRAHQVPVADVLEKPAHLKLIEGWLRSYAPEKLFDKSGRLIPELRDLAPAGTRRISANPRANGGTVRKPLVMPDFRDYAVAVKSPGTTESPPTYILGQFLRDVMRQNMTSFRVFGPDETASNQLQAIYEVTKKTWLADLKPEDADGGELCGRRPSHGDAQRAHARRLAGGLPAHRPARVLLDVRGVRPRHRFDGQPALQVDREEQGSAVAGAGLVAEHPHHLDRLAAGPQRVQPPGPGLPRRGHQQEPRRSRGSTCRRTRTAC